jgi:hypothetical protein
VTSSVLNLLISLALPACGIIGVKDKNITCLQYFCCCSYLTAGLAVISIIIAIISVTRGDKRSTVSLILSIFFLIVYVKGGRVSQRLQEQASHPAARFRSLRFFFPGPFLQL